MQRVSVAVSLVIWFVLAACGGAANTAPAGDENTVAPVENSNNSGVINVEMHDIYFGDENDNIDNPPVWTASSGAEVTVELANLGNLEHNWAVVEMGEEVPIPYTGGEDQEGLFDWSAEAVSAGETERFTFSVPEETGTYLVICSVPGHYPAMQGRLDVR